MFTGIIQAVGRVERWEPRAGDVHLGVAAADLDLSDVGVGDSIAVSGACLTVVELGGHAFAADVSNETLARTTLGRLENGDPVNLEKALRLADRLGGHLVSGHVDAVGTLHAAARDGRSTRWRIEVPAGLGRYIAAKGSVCVDGVSLTVNAVDGNGFDVNLIPHTIEHTAFAARHVGDTVNIEVDILARHLERLLVGAAHPGIDLDFLKRHGYA